jgi:HPt (histidine-containing phosphotransfer) domain-containing protein
MHDNNNNSVIADELEDIALQLAMLDSTNINDALDTVASELQRIEILSQLLELPTLEGISNWMISNTQVTKGNKNQLNTLLTEGHYSTWIEVLAALLREHESSLIATLKTEFTEPKWLTPIPPELLKNLLSWVVESTNTCDNEATRVDISLSSLSSIDQPLFETEKTSLSLFESNTESSSIDDLLLNAEKNTNNDLSILAEISGNSLNKENHSSDIDVDIIDIIDDTEDTNDTTTDLKVAAISSQNLPRDDQSKQPKPAQTAKQCEEKEEEKHDNELSNFTTEVDDIIMTLSTINTSKGIIDNTDKYIHEIQRLNLLAELSNYPAVTKASEWCERNIMAFSIDKSKDSQNFIASGECWTWLELTNACLSNPDDISLLPAVSAELMREDWAETFPVEDLQSFILFLQNPTTQEDTLSDQLDTDQQDLSTSDLNDKIENEENSELSLKWDDDVHPELLTVFFQETPDQISEVAALLLTISKSEADTEQHRHAARIAHTIKGASGVVGISALVHFTHKLEDILDYSVAHKLPLETADLLAEASDCLESLFEAIQDQQAAPEEFLLILEKLTATTNTLVADDINETTVAALDISDLPDFITNSNKSNNSSSSEEKLNHNSNEVIEIKNSSPNKLSEPSKEKEKIVNQVII